MALQRRMSLDTGENRLFVAFAKEVYNLLEIKLDNNVPCRDREKAFTVNSPRFCMERISGK